jgi:uncharacterized protein YxeA
MKKIILGIVFILVLGIGYKYFFYNDNSHINSKYGFAFSYSDGTKLESKGNILTCGSRYDCANFSGSVNFGYSAEYRGKLAYLGVIGTDYFYDFKNGEIYITSFNTPTDSIIASHYLVNKYGVKFYYTESSMMPHYCAYKKIGGEKDTIIVCFYETNVTSFDKKTPTGSWLTALETFRFK